MDLIKINLPSTIEVEGIFYDINTDFRAWLKFDRLLKNEEINEIEFKGFFLNDIPPFTEAALKELINFYNPPAELPRKMGGSSEPVIDYYYDGDLIYSAFLGVYQIDLLATDKHGRAIPLHWHKFLALLNGLHNTRLNDIMSYRAFNPNDKTDYKKQYEQLKNTWRIPTKETKAAKAQREKFNALFEKPTDSK